MDYKLVAVLYIPSKGDPFREERLKEVRRAEQLYRLLKSHCRVARVEQQGFGVEVVFEECDIDLPPEKGDVYELRPL